MSPRPPTATITLEHRCPACRRHFYVTLRDGSCFVRCPSAACGRRWLTLALPPGTTGRYVFDVLGPRLARGAIQAYLPALRDVDDADVLGLQVLVALAARGPAYLLIGDVPHSVATEPGTAHGPLGWVLETLGLREAA